MKALKENRYILIDDDDFDDRGFITKAAELVEIPAEIRTANDGNEAIELVLLCLEMGNDLPALIILDISMPCKDGVDTLIELKSNPDLKHIPVLILTTTNDPVLASKCYRIGANTYFCKPESPKGLRELMQGAYPHS